MKRVTGIGGIFFNAKDPVALRAWTTTPGTLISNQFAAVNIELEYAVVHDAADNENLVIAAALVETIAKKLEREFAPVATIRGAELVDR